MLLTAYSSSSRGVSGLLSIGRLYTKRDRASRSSSFHSSSRSFRRCVWLVSMPAVAGRGGSWPLRRFRWQWRMSPAVLGLAVLKAAIYASRPPRSLSSHASCSVAWSTALDTARSLGIFFLDFALRYPDLLLASAAGTVALFVVLYGAVVPLAVPLPRCTL